MPCKQAGDSIEQGSEYQNPGSLKVEITAPAVLIRQDVTVAGRHEIPRGGDWQFEQRSSQIVAGLSPIKARVGYDNFNSADEQSKKAQSDDPVGDADEGGMPRSGGERRRRDGRGDFWDARSQRRLRGFRFRHIRPPAEAKVRIRGIGGILSRERDGNGRSSGLPWTRK